MKLFAIGALLAVLGATGATASEVNRAQKGDKLPSFLQKAPEAGDLVRGWMWYEVNASKDSGKSVPLPRSRPKGIGAKPASRFKFPDLG